MLNWLTRYAPAATAVLHDAGSILDVGCGPHGLACIAPDVPFVGSDVIFAGEPAPSMVPVVLEPGPLLPFPDDAFDTVLCLDVLEHVPRAERSPFLAELARVAARRVVLACPTEASQPLDDLLRARLSPTPAWLSEHYECGLPAHQELQGLLDECFPGFAATPLQMPNELLCSMIVLADCDPSTASAAADSMRRHGREWAALLAGATFGKSFRAGWVLERTAAHAALVPGGLDRDGLQAALDTLGERCAPAALTPDARTPEALTPGALMPDALMPDALTPDVLTPDVLTPDTLTPDTLGPDTVELNTEAALRLWLAPDWMRPESWLGVLARYIAHGPADGSTCLCFDIGGADPELVTALLSVACEELAPEREFAEVLLVDGPVDLDAIVPVETGADVLAALGVQQFSPPGEPQQILERARRGKALADWLQTIADHHVFIESGDPWDDPEPLVTVPIATWKGHELLVERVIPSILDGTYCNVEVVVCSDGPDPIARAAVEALSARDSRVRYVELAERPTYPSYPWSFWETAGTFAANRALDGGRGRFIAPLDHDDEFTPTHIADLVACARTQRADFVYGQAVCEQRSRPPTVVGAEPLSHGNSATARSCTPSGSRTCATTNPAGCWRSPATGTCGGACRRSESRLHSSTVSC
ncbi:MAG: hypothetical protein QOH83_1405 [Solirubrobacteraceae bacterium]|nr:hypothetical protein [Solirubrobacteraceae bacterium]